MDTWKIDQGDFGLFIEGPGSLAILIMDFDPAKIFHNETDDSPFEALRIVHDWRYRLRDGTVLTCMSLAEIDEESEGMPSTVFMYMLMAGNVVTWEVPRAFAHGLYALEKNEQGNARRVHMEKS